jgi:hypothetical protein
MDLSFDKPKLWGFGIIGKTSIKFIFTSWVSTVGSLLIASAISFVKTISSSVKLKTFLILS